MTDLTIFFLGTFVTLLVCGTIGLLLWAAIEDGRYNREYREQQSDSLTQNSNNPQNVK